MTDELDKKARQRFGIQDEANNPTTTTTTTPELSNIQNEISETRRKITDLKNDLKNLRSGKKSSSNYAKDIEDTVKSLKEAEDKLSSLLGTDKKSVAKEDDALKNRLEAQKWLTEQEKELASTQIRNALELRQKELDLEEDSHEKRLKQNELNYDKEIQAIVEKHQALLKEQEEYTKQLYIKQRGTEKGFDSKSFDKSLLPLELQDTNIEGQIQKLIESAGKARDKANKESLKFEKESIKELLAQYLDYNQQKIAINEKFNTDLAKLKKLPESKDNDASIAQLYKDWDKALTELQKKVLEENGRGLVELYLFGDGSDFIQAKIKEINPFFEDISKLTVNQLNKIKKHINYIEFSPELLEMLKQAGVDVEKLVEALKNAKNASSEAIDDEKWGKVLEIAKKLSNSISKLGSALSEIGGGLGEIGGALEGISGSIDDIAVSFSSTATTEDKVSAGISGIADIIGMITSQIQKNKEAQEDWNAAIAEPAHNARMARIELEAYKEGNLFGVENPYARAIAGAKQYATSMPPL